jgi:probable ribonuclease FAU-1
VVRVEHVRPSGKSMRPREGVLVNATPDTILFRRSFLKGGHYDGLDIPIQTGDYGLTTIQEGAWFIKHAYYNKDDRLIGEYYNVNTPVELYPFGARYLDLEVDVVRKADGKPLLLDREKLALLSRRGAIGSALESKTMAVAGELMRTLSQ